jgi:phage tail sheath protein FI
MAETFLHGVEVVQIDDGPRPIQTVRSSVIGVVGTAPDADAAKFPFNTPVMIAGSRLEAAALDTVGDGAGTLPDAMDAIFDQAGAVVVVIRVEEGIDDAATRTNIIGGVDAETGAYTGVQAFLAAETAVGVAPRILCVPGFTGERPEDPATPGTYLANPVVAELLGIADRLRAVIIADGPDTNDADAQTYAQDFGSKRVYVVDPGVKVLDTDGSFVNEPASARVAGIIAKSDAERGFWWSPSNRQIYGIVGTTRAVDFALGDANARANLLNEGSIATIIRQDGFRLWGNRTLSDDPKWAFLSVVRTADMINESLLRAHLWAVDRNITKTYLEDVVEGVNAYLSHLTQIGAILGGRCWANPDLNTPSQLEAGKVYFDFDFTPPTPAEHVTFRSRLVNDYFEEVV